MRETALEPLTIRLASARSDQLIPVAEGTRADATNDGPRLAADTSSETTAPEVVEVLLLGMVTRMFSRYPSYSPVVPFLICLICFHTFSEFSTFSHCCVSSKVLPFPPCLSFYQLFESVPLGSQLDTSSDAPAPELVEVLLSAWQHPCFPVLPVLPVSFPF